ncbi:MAG: ribonuclease Z [Candidatus Micrarchaeia archaeon]
MLRITVLGSGASVPSVERNLPSLCVRYGGLYVFDCGEGTQRQMMKYSVGYGSVKAIFITHLHLDHYLGMFGLISTLKLMKRAEELHVFGPEGIEQIQFPQADFLRVHPVKQDGKVYGENGFSVSAFRTKHSSKSFGYVFALPDKWRFNEKKAKGMGILGPLFTKIQKEGKVKIGKKTIKLEEVAQKVEGKRIVYTGDTMPSPATVKWAMGATVLFHEMSFSNEHEEEAKLTMHSTAGQAAEIARKAGVERLVGCHISPRYEDAAPLEKQAQAVFPKSEVAKDGTQILVTP